MKKLINALMTLRYRRCDDDMQGWFDEVLAWRQRHLSDKQFTLVLAFFVGVFAAIAAYILHSLIHIIQGLVMRGIQL